MIGSWGRARSPVHLLGWGAIGLGLIDLATFNYPAFIPGIWLGLVLMAIVGVPATAFSTGYLAALQTEADDAYRGRVFGALSTAMGLLMMTGAAIAGAATERFGAVAVLTIDSLAYVAAGAYALRALEFRVTARVSRNQASVPLDPAGGATQSGIGSRDQGRISHGANGDD